MNILIVNWHFWLALFAFIISICALVVAIDGWKKLRYFMVLQQTRRHSRQLIPSKKGGSVYVIYNPVKNFDLNQLKKKISNIATNIGVEPVVWLPTTKEDSGYAMALQAVKEGAGLVVSAGGDGTVRAVAAGLCGTNVPLGILPVGTSNLLARNLGLPLDDLDESISIALTGRNRQMDIGFMKILDSVEVDEQCEQEAKKLIINEEYAFIIMAGIGFDGDMMANVPNHMKKKLGWLAYAFSGLKSLKRERMNVNLEIGSKNNDSHFKAHTVLFANCGILPGNIVLLPEARIDDGWIDVAIIDVRSKIFGWMSVASKVILQGFGIKTKIPSIIGKLDVLKTHKARMCAEKYHNIQIDGEYMGKAKELEVRVESDALLVRTI